MGPGLEVIKLEFILRLKIKRNDWLLADTSACSQSLHFILSLRLCSSFITSRPGWDQTWDPWICSWTHYRLGYGARSLHIVYLVIYDRTLYEKIEENVSIISAKYFAALAKSLPEGSQLIITSTVKTCVKWPLQK